MTKNLFFILVISLVFCSCKKDPDLGILSNLTSKHPISTQWLIACAGGNEKGIFHESAPTTSIMYYPVSGAENVQYFESNSMDIDPLNYDLYHKVVLPRAPIFNGYLERFISKSTSPKWCIITYLVDDSLRISDPIAIKTSYKPTEINNSLVIVDEIKNHPEFEWNDGLYDDNVIYFQSIIDESDHLISGTYTTDKNFAFYDLSNVVLNITSPHTIPVLLPDKTYRFVLMGVSDDNWVNLLIDQPFNN